MNQRHAERRWYDYALAFSRALSGTRATTSKHYRCWMLRIARLHPQLGEKLDEMKASLTVCRHVAAGDGNHEQNRRAVEALPDLTCAPSSRRSRAASLPALVRQFERHRARALRQRRSEQLPRRLVRDASRFHIARSNSIALAKSCSRSAARGLDVALADVCAVSPSSSPAPAESAKRKRLAPIYFLRFRCMDSNHD
jgi:hypothetical protein